MLHANSHRIRINEKDPTVGYFELINEFRGEPFETSKNNPVVLKSLGNIEYEAFKESRSDEDYYQLKKIQTLVIAPNQYFDNVFRFIGGKLKHVIVGDNCKIGSFNINNNYGDFSLVFGDDIWCKEIGISGLNGSKTNKLKSISIGKNFKFNVMSLDISRYFPTKFVYRIGGRINGSGRRFIVEPESNYKMLCASKRVVSNIINIL
jgi:hypothetical protein